MRAAAPRAAAARPAAAAPWLVGAAPLEMELVLVAVEFEGPPEGVDLAVVLVLWVAGMEPVLATEVVALNYTKTVSHQKQEM